MLLVVSSTANGKFRKIDVFFICIDSYKVTRPLCCYFYLIFDNKFLKLAENPY